MRSLQPTRSLAIGGVAISLSLLIGATVVAGGTAAPGALPDSSVFADPGTFDPVVVGVADPAAQLALGFALRGRDPDGMRQFLVDVNDPASPEYHRYLTPTEFGDRFGLAAADEERVIARLHAAGLTVTSRFPQRTSVQAIGSVAQVAALLGVTIEQLRDPRTGSTYLAASTPAMVPLDLTDAVVAVTGLERRLPVSAIDPADAPDPPLRGLKPLDLARAYDFESLWEAGITGEGQDVAIIQFGVDTDEDLAVFDAEFGITGPLPERIKVGTFPVDAPDDFVVEATLDTQVVRAVAPGANILVFGANAEASFGSVVDEVVADGRAKVVTISYGHCYAPGYVSQASVDGGALSFAAAAAAGVSLFFASGDWGAFTCHAFDPTDHQISSFWPSCANNVVSVGGTFLDVHDDGSYRQETGWQDYLLTSGTGGGSSPIDARPAFQDGVRGIDASNPARQCPDVSAAADPDTGYLIFATDIESGEASWHMVGGTSAAAPFWAGVMALIGQKAAAAGIDELGFLNPQFYEIAASTPSAFHDVRRGGNLVDAAGRGWDAATGLGSPDVAILADALIEAH
jgi:subtilase family serine protease